MTAIAGAVVLVVVALALVWWDGRGGRLRFRMRSTGRGGRPDTQCYACARPLDRGSDRRYYATTPAGSLVLVCETCLPDWDPA